MSNRYNVSYGLVRRVEIPRNSMWRVGSEVSKVYQVGTKQATTVV